VTELRKIRNEELLETSDLKTPANRAYGAGIPVVANIALHTDGATSTVDLWGFCMAKSE
jgi:hypothetical protein